MSFGGFLKQMTDTIRYNREILGKKKSVRELYKDEIRNRSSSYEHVNIDFVRLRVREKLKRNRTKEVFKRIKAITLVILFVGFISWMFLSVYSSITPRYIEESTPPLFNTTINPYTDELYLKTDYFIGGSIAAETFLKDWCRHQNSESYFETGEQFRSALYYYDSLVTEVYFFKSGEIVTDFPFYQDDEIHNIELTTDSQRIEFDFYDGKIVQGTYKEVLTK